MKRTEIYKTQYTDIVIKGYKKQIHKFKEEKKLCFLLNYSNRDTLKLSFEYGCLFMVYQRNFHIIIQPANQIISYSIQSF